MLGEQFKIIGQGSNPIKEGGKTSIRYLKFYQQLRNLIKWLNNLPLYPSLPTLTLSVMSTI